MKINKRTAGPRAEADPKPDDKHAPSGASNMGTCATCEGKGEMPDGTKCEDCGGTGKIAQAKAEDSEPEPGADADGDNDGDEKKKEAKAYAALAAKYGLDAQAPRHVILAAALATPRAMSEDQVDALLERKMQAHLAAQAKKDAEAQRVAKAKELRQQYAQCGASPDEQDGIEIVAMADYAKAEKMLKQHPGYVALGRMTHASRPIGAAVRPARSGQREQPKRFTVNGRNIEVHASGKGLADKATELVATAKTDTVLMQRLVSNGGRADHDGLLYAAALRVARQDHPELGAEYDAGDDE